MLRRLIVNLATNSIRASSAGSPVLIRLQSAKSGESIIWSVIDQGAGIAASDLSRIAERQVSMGGGEGLGISICRQLAALHFSTLGIRSRQDVGTQVSFTTATGGPSSVAEHWARWRISHRDPRRQPIHRDVDARPPTTQSPPTNATRSPRSTFDVDRVTCGERITSKCRSMRGRHGHARRGNGSTSRG